MARRLQHEAKFILKVKVEKVISLNSLGFVSAYRLESTHPHWFGRETSDLLLSFTSTAGIFIVYLHSKYMVFTKTE